MISKPEPWDAPLSAEELRSLIRVKALEHFGISLEEFFERYRLHNPPHNEHGEIESAWCALCLLARLLELEEA